MNKERKIIPDKIHVLNIKTIKGNIESAPDADPEQIKGYRFDHSLGTGINEEESLIGLKLTVDIEALDAKDEPIGISASYTHNFTFNVENLEDFLEKDNNEDDTPAIDPLMVATLVGIAYSTVRGIIYTRTQSTSLNGVVLPVIDPKKLLEYDDGKIE
ncbi:hypothetical protein QWZ08_00330 [Ferruginibacter paludis]|uniref:hypothetical protein n=1 Tax=Ferruginibacter paludis TaxID=1310417 RepID=UPI0025B5E70E|nr:hypothetical protein [Ferruginibacter paludis]MDN3654047.1 hypothetical protein [Ferruginibacter paludis]